MKGGARLSIAGVLLGLLALAGCGRGYFQDSDRADWRREAEVACLKSGALKSTSGAAIVQIEPIAGPGVCGADFPFKVAALGSSAMMSFAENLRPPASIPHASAGDMPRWPANTPRYAPPATVPSQPVNAPVQHGNMRWVPGPPAMNPPVLSAPEVTAPAGQPMSIVPGAGPMDEAPAYRPPSAAQRAAPMGQGMGQGLRQDMGQGMGQDLAMPRYRPVPDDIPDDAIIPRGGSAAVPAPAQRGAYHAPAYEPPPRELPRLGPATTAAIPMATLKPAATLACPMVSALERWVGEGVQPAALRWFGSPVVSIRQISAYSCRRMVGAGGRGISEHSFGNALDVAGFTLADGRTITVQHGWRGSPEEQGFLHDVQLFACNTFNTVLAPGYNAAHYNHFHFDLMRRANGRRPCRPKAIPGEVMAARARANYASKQRSPAHTGSIGAMVSAARAEAVAGEDGYVDDEDENDAAPPPARSRAFPFSLFGAPARNVVPPRDNGAY